MKKLCILEIVPSISYNNKNIYNDPRVDHFFITYKEYNERSIKFNEGKSWGENRNELFNHLDLNSNNYEYFMFIDYDIVLENKNKSNDNILDRIILSLDKYKPVMYRTSGYNDELKTNNEYSIGGFINHSFTILREDIMKYVFPLPTKMGGFWDSASWINTIVVPCFEKSILVDNTIIAINTINSGYAHNKNVYDGKKAMNDLYLETMNIYTDNVKKAPDIHRFKHHYMSNRHDNIDKYIITESVEGIIDSYIKIEKLEKLKKENI